MTRLVLLAVTHGNRRAEDIAPCGFSAHLLKPVPDRELRHCLTRLLTASSSAWADSTQPIPVPRPDDTAIAARVLLAEDNFVNQRVARGALEKLGCTVDIVDNGADAVAAWENGHYEIILMDCQMPTMDGYQAALQIRSRERSGEHVPIVALTADAMKGTEQQCLASGMDGYLTKPLDRALLAKTLRVHLSTVAPVAPATPGVADGPAAPPPARATTTKSPAAVVAPSTDDDLPVSDDPAVIAAPVDWDQLLSTTDGDTMFAKELLQLFVDSSDAVLRDIDAAMHRGDLRGVQLAAHALKGSSANLYAHAKIVLKSTTCRPTPPLNR